MALHYVSGPLFAARVLMVDVPGRGPRARIRPENVPTAKRRAPPPRDTIGGESDAHR